MPTNPLYLSSQKQPEAPHSAAGSPASHPPGPGFVQGTKHRESQSPPEPPDPHQPLPPGPGPAWGGSRRDSHRPAPRHRESLGLFFVPSLLLGANPRGKVICPSPPCTEEDSGCEEEGSETPRPLLPVLAASHLPVPSPYPRRSRLALSVTTAGTEPRLQRAQRRDDGRQPSAWPWGEAGASVGMELRGAEGARPSHREQTELV